MSSICVSETCVDVGVSPGSVANSTTKVGWTLGGGLEASLSRYWLARAEYRRFRFTMVRTAGTDPVIDNYDVRLRTHTLNFGLA